MRMRKNVFAVVGPLLLGCALFVSGSGSAKEITTCGGSAQPAAAPDIAISAAELGQCGGKTAEKKDGDCSYKVTNTGNVKLINVRVMDERFDAVSCQKGVLAAGESMTCTASGPSKSERVSGMGGCAVADHVVASEVGVLVTTKGDCTAEPLAQTTAMNR